MQFLQAGLFTASLTSFIIDSKQNLKVNPGDQMIYYLQQNVTIPAQMSQQISSITPHVAISPPPPPYPDFGPLSIDIRVNVSWFMALVFSLFSALLVQQWARDYMHVFQRYSDHLKSAQIRQYLDDGCEKMAHARRSGSRAWTSARLPAPILPLVAYCTSSPCLYRSYIYGTHSRDLSGTWCRGRTDGIRGPGFGR